MRKARVALAAVVGLSAAVAQADIEVTSTRARGTGADAGFDVVRFFAKFSPGGPEDASAGLQSAALTISTYRRPGDFGPAPTFHFRFTDLNADGFPDWDPTGLASRGSGGTASSALVNTSTIGSFIAVRPYDLAGNQQGSFDPPPGSGVYPFPFTGNGKAGPQQSFDADGSGSLGDNPGDVDPVALYQDKLSSFRVEGFNAIVDPSAKSTSAQAARGALFAVAVVPTGAALSLHGTTPPNFTAGGLATPSTNAQDIRYDELPEPSTAALAGLGLVSTLGHRRRKPSEGAEA
jgi:hypothetical protein